MSNMSNFIGSGGSGKLFQNREIMTPQRNPTFTVPDGVDRLFVCVFGAGGGGRDNGGVEQNGGGGGGYTEKLYNVVAGQISTVVVGAGGVFSTTIGGAGATSSFTINGVAISATGGSGGLSVGGVGGIGSGGDYQANGGSGGAGSSGSDGVGGGGSGSPFGTGGAGPGVGAGGSAGGGGGWGGVLGGSNSISATYAQIDGAYYPIIPKNNETIGAQDTWWMPHDGIGFTVLVGDEGNADLAFSAGGIGAATPNLKSVHTKRYSLGSGIAASSQFPANPPGRITHGNYCAGGGSANTSGGAGCVIIYY